MISIVVGAIVMFAVGALWFTVLFGMRWSKLMQRTPEQLARVKAVGMKRPLVIMFLLNLVSCGVLYFLLPQLLVLSTFQFLIVVFIVWLGFTLPSFMNSYLWEGRSIELMLINAGGSLLGFVAGASVVYYLQ